MPDDDVSSGAAATGPRGWGAGAALAALMTAALAAWSPLLGRSTYQVVPLAAIAVLASAGRLDRRVALVAFVVWLPAVVLLAGASAARLLPAAWPSMLADLRGGIGQLITSSTLRAARDQRPLAAAFLVGGAAWSAAAALASGSPSRARSVAALAVGGLPWIAALARGPVDATVWQGGLALLAVLLWWSSQRMATAPAVALSLVVAAVSAATAQAVAPHERWFRLPGQPRAPRPFSALTIEPTFGPVRDRRRGRSMLEIHAAQPALWRMQTLDMFDGFGWRVTGGPGHELPQPAARPTWVDVRVRGLRNELAVSPGRITDVEGARTSGRVAGEGWRLTRPPRPGDHYRVRAEVVDASADQLRRAPAPTDRRLARYTRLGWSPLFGIDVPLFGKPRNPRTATVLDATPYRRVNALARRLAAGARTEWDVVSRVQRYLRDSGRFRYTTHVPSPGLLPLVDFLLHDHAGYCQHFAGAAALLLRLVGVPARVVAGFATGVARGGGRFDVRDLDAHDWVEVYFQRYGWVAFNPTPPAAPANVPRRLDLLPAPGERKTSRGSPRVGTIGALVSTLALAVAIARASRRRRERAHAGDVLAQLARRAGGHVDPSTTLAEVRDQLAARVGRRTAALAAAAERARYARTVPASAPPPRAQIVRALLGDVGLARAARLLLLPAPPDRSHRRA